MTKLTQCPHCEATFKVTEDQLSVAGGKVRCGACMHIFDALAHLFEAPKESPPADKETPDEKTNTVSDADEYEASGGLINDDPEVDSESEHYLGESFKRTQLSDEMLELDTTDSSPGPDDDEELGPENQVDESWAEGLLDENQSVTSAQPQRTTATHHDQSLVAERIYDELDVAREPHLSEKRERSLASSLVISLGCLALLVVLLFQLASFYYVPLAKQLPHFKTWYSNICQFIPCLEQHQVALNQIQSQKLTVRSHPELKEALIVDAIIFNEANHSQPFPLIAFYFSDINKNVIAQKSLLPSQYLAGEMLNWTQMPSRTPIRIAVEIKDPGPSAVSYAIDFFGNTPD